MTQALFVKLAKYNQAMNVALYAAAEQLTDDARTKDMGAYFKSIHATLNHILWADKNWLRRFVIAGHGHGKLTDTIYANIQDRISEHAYLIHSDFKSLKQDRITVDAKLVLWLTESMNEAKLQQTLQYRNADSEDQRRPFTEVLTHIFNHQTHHRGQVTTLLAQLGVDYGVTDFIFYSNQF